MNAQERIQLLHKRIQNWNSEREDNMSESSEYEVKYLQEQCAKNDERIAELESILRDIVADAMRDTTQERAFLRWSNVHLAHRILGDPPFDK